MYHVVPFRKHPPTHSLPLPLLCLLWQRAPCMLPLLRSPGPGKLPSPPLHLCSQGNGWVLLWRRLPYLPVTLFSLVRHSCRPPPPHPQGPRMGQDDSQGSSRAVGSVLCLDAHPALHLLFWLQLGGPRGHGWAGCLGLGGQGCWPELAWRSHSSPGKAENRQPLCPGVLLQPRSLSLCSPLLLLPPLFSLLSLLVPFHLLHPLPSSLRIPEGPCHLLPSISPLPLSEAQIPSLPFLFFILSHPAPSLWPVRSHLFSC